MEKDNNDDNDSAGELDAGAAAAGRKKKLLIIAAAVGLLLVLGGGAAWFLRSGDAGTADSAATVATPAPAIYASLGERFVVTLQQEGKQRYFQVSLSVMAREQSAIDALTVHAPLIRGRLVSLLGSQDFAALQTEQGKLALRASILGTVQEILTAETGHAGVEQVFFTEFVLQ
ncbi:MAG: flagellar basal body-associated FliL family protein [Gammaproteobacteria bacterium]|jgi:flagellar FliL protein|nr:flagellar basal body-associated FliL family protein [Gammaproteobacteria bacterium]MBP6052154.1 flagellar basal body-associated FliL family protein [Pseudomonadales bacterium]MBK6582215.1 flagellar basal body-associated FliL family protein [Gammaproteobacteria bacterium]MBK7521511.1 flagellar basal body-associated FliL family protein [Gammaproteobacteria bacterium]MBK7729286.1 flagellar basal body-associated FliL family protein [Gammaproteobacteria bacterium]